MSKLEGSSTAESVLDLATLGEFGLISRFRPYCDATLRKGFCGVGDDCAVLPLSGCSGESSFEGRVADEEGYLLSAADSLVSGVHFLPTTCTPFSLGAKALAVNLSDLAAMGAYPISATVCLHLPPATPVDYVDELYRGLSAEARSYQCSIVGGDTVKGGELALSIGILGFSRTKPLMRSGAQVGDDLWVSGDIGLSGAGLKILLASGAEAPESMDFGLVSHKWKNAHMRPIPRLALGQALRERNLATACIDVSDGLLQDVGHICRASGLRAVIDPEKVPVPAVADGFFSRKQALIAGEDYELAFTAPQTARDEILKLKTSLNLPGLSLIGELKGVRTGESGGVFIETSSRILVAIGEYLGKDVEGFCHFR